MSRIRIAVGLVAAAGALAAPMAHATTTICNSQVPQVYSGCTYIHDDGCVNGGGRIAGRPYYIICT